MEPHESADTEALVIDMVAANKDMGGVYANFANVGHDEHAFTIDFFAVDKLSEEPRAFLQARVRMSHRHAVALHGALGENIAKWARNELEARAVEQESLERLASEGDER